MPNINETLDERGKRYGKFEKHAELTQELKLVMRKGHQWFGLYPDQMEALEMIQHKVGRILNGDPDYADSWVDIAGYAQLVANRLEKKLHEPKTPQANNLSPAVRLYAEQPAPLVNDAKTNPGASMFPPSAFKK